MSLVSCEAIVVLVTCNRVMCGMSVRVCHTSLCAYQISFQPTWIESDESLRECFKEEPFESLMLDTGFRKPLSSLAISDKEEIISILTANVLLKVKPELDQFIEGLDTCGVLGAMRKSPQLMKVFLTHTTVDLTPGK